MAAAMTWRVGFIMIVGLVNWGAGGGGRLTDLSAGPPPSTSRREVILLFRAQESRSRRTSRDPSRGVRAAPAGIPPARSRPLRRSWLLLAIGADPFDPQRMPQGLEAEPAADFGLTILER